MGEPRSLQLCSVEPRTSKIDTLWFGPDLTAPEFCLAEVSIAQYSALKMRAGEIRLP
jgi:hypothetical protein